jgi:hypothetical protein
MDHHETRQLQKYLEACLRAQHKHKEANEIAEDVAKAGKCTLSCVTLDTSLVRDSYLMCFFSPLERAKKKKDQKAMQPDYDDNWFGLCASPSSWFSFAEDGQESDQIEEMKQKQETKASRKYWRQIRAERFSFLDSNPDESEVP